MRRRFRYYAPAPVDEESWLTWGYGFWIFTDIYEHVITNATQQQEEAIAFLGI